MMAPLSAEMEQKDLEGYSYSPSNADAARPTPPE